MNDNFEAEHCTLCLLLHWDRLDDTNILVILVVNNSLFTLFIIEPRHLFFNQLSLGDDIGEYFYEQ